MIKNYARCTCEIKSRIAMEKAACNREKILFTSKFKEETSEVLHLEHNIEWG
jgi:hypothetical protein